MKAEGKWFRQIDGQTPVAEAAALVLTTRMAAMGKLLPAAAQRSEEDVEFVHQLRVATRRASSAVSAFAPCIDRSVARKTRRRLRNIRRAAGSARTCDVHGIALAQLRHESPAQLRPVIDEVMRFTHAERREAQSPIRAVAAKYPPAKLDRDEQRLIAAINRRRGVGAEPFDAFVRHSLPAEIDEFAKSALSPTHGLESLHDLRIHAKKLRYGLELFASSLGDGFDATYAQFKRFQDALGEVNDHHEMIARLERYLDLLNGPKKVTREFADAGLKRRVRRAGVELLIDMWKQRRAGLVVQFEARWDEPQRRAFVADLRALLERSSAMPDESCDPPIMCPNAVAAGVTTVTAAGEQASNGRPLASTAQRRPGGSSTVPDTRAAISESNSMRLAAIDVGTNSLRLVVVEVLPDGGFRMLDDEKVRTRLGEGFATTGALDVEAMRRSAEAIAHLCEIARGYSVQRLEAIATCAVREASNGDMFVGLVRDIAGVPLQVISAEAEARLAHRCVRHSFDLRGSTSAIVDIGGGSTEVVLCERAIINDIYTLPLGAVRVTERFDITDVVTDKQYKRIRRKLRATCEAHIGRLPLAPQMIIGTGGTFTTLASMFLQREADNRDGAILPFSARGCELRRSDVKLLLDHLRNTPLAQRARTPGLNPDRADIIVAGLAIVDCILEHLGVNTLRVHDQGIRTGLILSMIDEMGLGGVVSNQHLIDRMESARRFARACRCDMAHGDQVVRLSLQIFDQIASYRGDRCGLLTESSRALLEAAAILHKAGCHISYARHHKHSYHLIMHSDLPGFDHRELELIANIARYHRRAHPKKRHSNFARLDKSQRTQVRMLAGIMRIASGLNRTRSQRVDSVHLTVDAHRAIFEVSALDEPVVDLWGAQRKRELFEDAFDLRARFVWRPRTAATEFNGRVGPPRSLSGENAEPAKLTRS